MFSQQTKWPEIRLGQALYSMLEPVLILLLLLAGSNN